MIDKTKIRKVLEEAITNCGADGSVTFDYDEKSEEAEFNYATCTGKGQDWEMYHSLEVSPSMDTIDVLHSILDSVDSDIKDYDEDYEAYQYIGPDGHGTNGAPYHIVDIVEDMLDGLDSYRRFYEALDKEVEKLGE